MNSRKSGVQGSGKSMMYGIKVEEMKESNGAFAGFLRAKQRREKNTAGTTIIDNKSAIVHNQHQLQ